MSFRGAGGYIFFYLDKARLAAFSLNVKLTSAGFLSEAILRNMLINFIPKS